MDTKWILISIGILLVLLVVYKKRSTILGWFGVGKKHIESQPLISEKKQKNNIELQQVNNYPPEKQEEYIVFNIASSPEEGKEMELGDIYIKLYDDICPRTCENFRSLSKIEYKGCTFHRLIAGFMVQCGDYENHNGTGGESIWGGNFPDENFVLKNKKYSLSCANSGPDTNGSQFFINFADNNFLDGKHVVFGQVVKGFNILNIMEKLPTDENDKPKQLLYIRNTRVTNSLNG